MRTMKEYPCARCGKVRKYHPSHEGKSKIVAGKVQKRIPDLCKPCSHQQLAEEQRASYPETVRKKCPECGKERDVKWEARYHGPLCHACCGKRGSKNQTFKHGGLTKYHKELYSRWYGMFRRCKDCKTYVQKNIAVCEEWKNFATFVDWSHSHGYVPHTQQHLDRINSNRGYSPDNCRWISEHENLSRPTAITVLDIEFIADKTRQGWIPHAIYNELYSPA